MRTFQDRTALVTGAAGGIGAALARALAAAGAHLALVDVDPDRLEAVAAPLRSPGRRVTLHPLDVADPAAWEALAATLREAHGGLDLLVHNAGVTVHGPLADQAAGDLDWLLDVNLRGPLHGTRALLPLLRVSPDAHVVFVSSMAALFPVPLQATYAASKAGVRALAAALRVELAGEGIGVSAVLPGTIATPFLARARTTADQEAAWMARQMLAFGTSPDAVARAILAVARWNRAERTVGPDAAGVACVQRLAPWLLPALLGLGWRARARWSAP